MTPKCRTVSESLWRKLINSIDFAGGTHDHLCFAKDRGMADLYEKYMAYCACQHLVTPKSCAKSSFRAGARVLAFQSSQRQVLWHKSVSCKMRMYKSSQHG